MEQGERQRASRAEVQRFSLLIPGRGPRLLRQGGYPISLPRIEYDGYDYHNVKQKHTS